MKNSESNPLNICQVALARDLPIIKENIKEFNKYYSNINFFIICPSKELKIFSKLKSNKISIINEETIISYKSFYKIANIKLQKSNYNKIIQNRLKWYYQQVLKISFIIDFYLKNKKNIIIWDADTIILKKIIFFRNSISVKYGITKYFHRAYYLTNKEIFGYYPHYFLSFLMQFIAISKAENNFLILCLDKYIPKNRMRVAEWITKIVMKSVVSAHKIYNGSMFSEYEMIGFSNIFYQYNNQKIIKGFRDHLNGKLSVFQKVILRFFDYKFIAYEHSHQNQNSQGMLKRKQTWFFFFKLLLNSLSNNYFRKLKHYYYLITIGDKNKKKFLYR
jgi:hypothetical protein